MVKRTSKLKQSRSIDKRASILEAAIRVFARKGFHGCRVSDIAEEAGIAYGLVYHYFKNKETVLLSIFDEKWGMFLQVLRAIEENQENFEAKLNNIVNFLFTTYRHNPELSNVVLLELIHSHDFRKPEMLERFEWAYSVIQKIFRDADARGELNSNVSVNFAPFLFLGNLETLFTGLALKMIPDNEESSKELAAQISRLYSNTTKNN